MNLSTLLIALLSGLGAGVLSGIFGVGGGTLAVPMLMLQGAGIHQATALSLVYISFASFSGSLVYWLKKQLELKTVALLGLSASLTVFLGVKLSRLFSPQQLAWLFAGFMVLVLAMFGWKERSGYRRESEKAPLQGGQKLAALIGTGLLAGLIASVLGVGGGLIMVPLLALLCGYELKQATCLSLAGVCLIAIIGVGQHALFGELFGGLQRLGLNLLVMSAAGMAGAPLGVSLNRQLPEKVLRTGFVILCLAVMAYMLLKTWS